MNVSGLSLSVLSAAISRGDCSSEEAVTSCLERIDGMKELNNFITVTADDAVEAAKRADEMRAAGGEVSPLCGVPIAVKDNICTLGVKTTCASESLKDYVPNFDADIIARLKRAGAVIVGKTNMDELAMGSTNETSYFGCVKNVLDDRRVPGGSSGGSANCVAAGQVFAALGTDTGGSIRQPAAYCGVVGLKPTFGSLSNVGLIGLAPSLDQIGTFTRSCADAWMMFCALKADNDRCAFNVDDGYLSGKTIGVPIGVADVVGLNADVKQAFRNTVEKLEKLGATVTEVGLPDFGTALAVYHVISSAEAAASLLSGRLPVGIGNASSFGAEVRRRIVSGACVLNGDNYEKLYIQAAKVRNVIKRMYIDALSACDVIVTPSALSTATKLGAITDPQKTHASDMFAAAVSLAGLPAVSVPCGFSNGLPIGIQIIGKYDSELEILSVGQKIME